MKCNYSIYEDNPEKSKEENLKIAEMQILNQIKQQYQPKAVIRPKVKVYDKIFYLLLNLVLIIGLLIAF